MNACAFLCNMVAATCSMHCLSISSVKSSCSQLVSQFACTQKSRPALLLACSKFVWAGPCANHAFSSFSINPVFNNLNFFWRNRCLFRVFKKTLSICTRCFARRNWRDSEMILTLAHGCAICLWNVFYFEPFTLSCVLILKIRGLFRCLWWSKMVSSCQVLCWLDSLC